LKSKTKKRSRRGIKVVSSIRDYILKFGRRGWYISYLKLGTRGSKKVIKHMAYDGSLPQGKRHYVLKEIPLGGTVDDWKYLNKGERSGLVILGFHKRYLPKLSTSRTLRKRAARALVSGKIVILEEISPSK